MGDRLARLLACCLGLAVLALATPAAASVPERRYVVSFTAGTSTADGTSEVRRGGGRVERELQHVFPGAVVSMSPTAAAALARSPRIAVIEPDQALHAAEVWSQSAAPWGLDRLDQRALPVDGTFTYGLRGGSVTAYVVDSGIRADHVDFGGRVQGGMTVIADGQGTGDCLGHGTHVAGILGGQNHGVAKAVDLVPVRVLDCKGLGTLSGVITGLDWVAADHTADAPAVANLSLGGGASTSLDTAVQALVDDGVTVVVAAGNSNADACTVSPARVPAALTVGASDAADVRGSFSNHGSCLDLFAPGVDIVSTWSTSATATARQDGTSMAAPFVAGAAAALLELDPALPPAGVAGRLLQSATTGVVADAGAGSPDRLLWADPRLPYSPVVPERLLDTRAAQIGYVGDKPVARQVVELQVSGAGAAQVPADAGAVVLNVTGVLATRAGHVTVWPCGSPMPATSNLNLEAGEVRPNLVVTPLGEGGKVCLYTHSGTHLVADLVGYHPVGSSYSGVVPERLLDTRAAQIGYVGGKPVARQVVELQVPGAGAAQVPADAGAVVLNVTGVLATRAGHVTVWPCGSPMPATSNLNLEEEGVAPNLVVTPLGEGGKVCLYTNSGTHLVADLVGYDG